MASSPLFLCPKLQTRDNFHMVCGDIPGTVGKDTSYALIDGMRGYLDCKEFINSEK